MYKNVATFCFGLPPENYDKINLTRAKRDGYKSEKYTAAQYRSVAEESKDSWHDVEDKLILMLKPKVPKIIDLLKIKWDAISHDENGSPSILFHKTAKKITKVPIDKKIEDEVEKFKRIQEKFIDPIDHEVREVSKCFKLEGKFLFPHSEHSLRKKFSNVFYPKLKQQAAKKTVRKTS